MFVSDRRLYLTEDKSTVVEEGDPSARYLLVGKGGTVPLAEVERLGLKKSETKEQEKPEDKQRTTSEDKSAKSAKKTKKKK